MTPLEEMKVRARQFCERWSAGHWGVMNRWSADDIAFEFALAERRLQAEEDAKLCNTGDCPMYEGNEGCHEHIAWRIREGVKQWEEKC